MFRFSFSLLDIEFFPFLLFSSSLPFDLPLGTFVFPLQLTLFPFLGPPLSFCFSLEVGKNSH